MQRISGLTGFTLWLLASCGGGARGAYTRGAVPASSSSTSDGSSENSAPVTDDASLLARPASSALGDSPTTSASSASSVPLSHGASIPEVGARTRVALPEVKGAMAYYAPIPRGKGALPVSLMLHGMCASGELECPFFAEGATPSGWLLCPDASFACEGGGFMWAGPPSKQAATQDAALRQLRTLYPDDVGDGGVLIGYSLGAQAALALLAREPGHWRALMIVNSSNIPTTQEITRSGVRRIALVAGDHDGTSGKLFLAAKQLKAAGIDARFFSLGKVGHFFDASTSARMVAPLAWAME